MERLCFIFVQIFGYIAHLNAGIVERIYIRDKVALKGSDIQLVCEISQFQSDLLFIYKTDTRLPSSHAGITSMTQCIKSQCLTIAIGRYSFSADSSNVFINITSVYRFEDQKWWTCAISNQRKDMLLNVTTVQIFLNYVNPPGRGQDLAQNPVQLHCTTGCCYPQPTITWHYAESGNDSLQVWSSFVSASASTSACSDSEEKISSTLSLPKFTTFFGNVQKTVQFKCSIQSFTGLPQPLYTSFSTDVQFAVRISSAILKDGTNTVSGQLQVVGGVNKTLTCYTGVSRPAATIVWYIETEEKQRSTSNTLTFTPESNDHNKQVYCKAFNIQPESAAVTSNKLRLYVQVQVSSAILKDGLSPLSAHLQVDIGVSKTLTCDTDASRPAATIVWYIGTEEKQRSTSNTYTFKPESSDHNKSVYCKAYNIQPESEAVSSNKSSLNIKGIPASPMLLYYFGLCSGANIFTFVGGNNGGRLQTFVIETATNGTTDWIEQLRFNETDADYLQNEESLYRFNIKGLAPGVHNIRVLAGNKIGWIADEIALTLQFIVHKVEEQEYSKQEQSDGTAAIVGGSLSVVIVGIIVTGVFVMRRMTCKRKVKKTSENKPGSTYDSLQTQHEIRATYSTLTTEMGFKGVSTDKTYENVNSQENTSQVL